MCLYISKYNLFMMYNASHRYVFNASHLVLNNQFMSSLLGKTISYSLNILIAKF